MNPTLFQRTALILILFSLCTIRFADCETQILFTNGRWFDGTGFTPRTGLVRNGNLYFVEKDIGATETIDLHGGYVIPPFCEAHNHNIGVSKPKERNTKYLNAGVYYVMILNDAPQMSRIEKDYWLRKDTVDVAFAHGGITCRGGHPVELLEGIKKGGGYPPGTELADHAYFEIDSDQELQRKWQLVRSFQPDVIKLFLQHSEEYKKRKDDPVYYGNRGLSPEVFRRAVEMAHRDKFRVAVHVVSAEDFHLAVQAGADIIAHLSGFLDPERIDPSDAQAAAQRNIIVISTSSLPQSMRLKNLEEIQQAQKQNLKLLKNAGVTITVGSDNWSDTSHMEARYLRSLGIFTDAELLKMWTQQCAATIFPERKIGQLKTGYEADFLVLDGNPLEDFDATRRISLRVKAGVVLPDEP